MDEVAKSNESSIYIFKKETSLDKIHQIIFLPILRKSSTHELH
jgi:hypothetical protein